MLSPVRSSDQSGFSLSAFAENILTRNSLSRSAWMTGGAWDLGRGCGYCCLTCGVSASLSAVVSGCGEYGCCLICGVSASLSAVVSGCGEYGFCLTCGVSASLSAVVSGCGEYGSCLICGVSASLSAVVGEMKGVLLSFLTI